MRDTQLLCETLAKLKSPPKVLLCASAIGYYGDRGEELLNESSPPVSGFLSEVCESWEAVCRAGPRAGIRVCNMRLGVVLQHDRRRCAKMLTPFKLGVGGKLGDGKQWMSWVALDDIVGAFHHALDGRDVKWAGERRRPAGRRRMPSSPKRWGACWAPRRSSPMPQFAARLAFGEMSDALLFASQHVVPQRCQETRYEFRFPSLEGAYAPPGPLRVTCRPLLPLRERVPASRRMKVERCVNFDVECRAAFTPHSTATAVGLSHKGKTERDAAARRCRCLEPASRHGTV